MTVAELYRLCRDLADILTVRAWCQAHEVKVRVLPGALSGIVDLAATDASTTMLGSTSWSRSASSSATCKTNSPAMAWPRPGPTVPAPGGDPAWPSSVPVAVAEQAE